MKASDLLVKCLENEGVEYIFGIIGSEVVDLADSLSSSKQIKYIPVRHEQGAAFIADVYGRISGKPGVCLATLGPGATNLLTGVASANLDHSPVVAITGQSGLEEQHQNAHQYIDIQRIFEPAAKWSVQIKGANTIPDIIRKSFRISTEEKPGAVLIEIPKNIASEENVTTVPLPITGLPESVPSSQALNKALELIHNSQQPFLIIGNGVIRQDAIHEVVMLIKQLGAPVATSFMAKGILPKNHLQNFYTIGFSEKDYALRGLEEADLLVTIGFDVVESPPSHWNKQKVPVLHIDSIAAEVNENYPIQGELIGNLNETLKLLNSSNLSSKPWMPSGDLKNRIQTSYSIVEERGDDSSLSIKNILHGVERALTDETIVISDVGSHKVSIARTFQPKHAKQLIISNGFASMGISIPGAIGAKLASPEKTVICITGDGGALMNFAELETARRLGLSFVIILLNDSMLKLEVQKMEQQFGEHYGVTFTNPDFVQLANSFSVKAIRPKDLQEFEGTLKEAIQSDGDIVLIDTILNSKD